MKYLILKLKPLANHSGQHIMTHLSRHRVRALVIPLAVLFFTLFLVSTGFGDESILQLNSEGVSSSDVPVKAREESLNDALTKGCLEATGNLIGATRLEKSLPAIKAKVLSQKQKFIQYYKASEPQKKGTDTVTNVNMKISISSLRDILAKEGILYQSDGPATILPVIRFIEKSDNGRTFNWWIDEATTTNAFLREQEKMVLHQFDGLFRAKNFFLIDPVTQHYVQWMPQPFRSESPTLDDLIWMADFYKAQMVISGDVILLPGASPHSVKTNIKLVAYHSVNGRVVGEVTRSFEVPSTDWELGEQQVLRKAFTEVSKDLAVQVFDEWSRGTLGASLLKISLRGTFNYQDLENFKRQIMVKVGDIKKIRERRMGQGEITYEVDSASGLPGLIKSFETTSFDGFHLNVEQAGNDYVALRWGK